MLEQIARNKRRTVLYLGVFVLTWLGIGATIGALFAVTGTATTDNASGDVVIGLAVAAGVGWSGVATVRRHAPMRAAARRPDMPGRRS